MNLLLDETRSPPLREVIGRLMSAAERADFAVTNVRLAAIDVSAAETGGIARCRFLLGRLDARDLTLFGASPAGRSARLRGLRDFLASGRVEIRNAGTGAWHPDFSMYHGLRGSPQSQACIVGAHYFHQPLITGGPSFTCVLTDPSAVAAACNRFDELWQRAHDVSAIVVDAVSRIVEQDG